MSPMDPKKDQTQPNPRRNLPFEVEEIDLEEGEIVEITPDMIIGDVIAAYPQTMGYFKSIGFGCVGCYASTYESIQEGAQRHHLDPQKICDRLNKIIAQ